MTTGTKRTLTICAVLFALAATVRFVVWQNDQRAGAALQSGVQEMYVHDATYLLNGDVRTFVEGENPPTDATIILHPQGYPLLIAAIFATLGASTLVPLQILFSSLIAIIVFFAASFVSGRRVAFLAGCLTAFCPQSAYYAGIMLPDGLTAIVVATAVLLALIAVRHQAWSYALGCGALIGLSCWLRPNALLLIGYFVVAFAIVMPRRLKLRFGAIALFGTVLVIAPMTIRNAIVFRAFIPASLGAGFGMVYGLSEYDTDKRFNIPPGDDQLVVFEAERFGRPEYAKGLARVDAVAREKSRLAYCLGIIEQDPIWYATSVAKRGISNLRFERVPVISSEHDERDQTPRFLYIINIPLKLFQKVFITAVFLPLTLLGICLVWRDPQKRSYLLILLVAPLYCATIQPLTYTEYRYVQVVVYIALIFSAVGIYWLWKVMRGAIGGKISSTS